MERKVYKNSIETDKRIKEAVIELLRENKTIDKINISDVVKVAKVNRGTFYNHYNSLEEVIIDIEENIMNGFLSKVETNKRNSMFDINQIFFYSLSEYFQEREEQIKPIVSSLPIDIFKIIYTRLYSTYKEVIDLKEDNAEKEILFSGITVEYLKYLSGNSPRSLKDIARFSVELMNKQ